MKKIVFLIILCTTMFVGVRWYFPISADTVNEYLSYGLYPVFVVNRHVVMPCRAYINDFQMRQYLTELVYKTRKERDDARARVIELEALMDTAQVIQNAQEFTQHYNLENKPLAMIVDRGQSDKGDFLLVDKGSSSGITKDMIAIYNNEIIGRVVHVYPSYCKIVLITDVLCKVPAYCEETKTEGIVEGAGKGNLELRYVCHFDAVKVGDVVKSSGKGLLFPRGFALGTVTNVTRDEDSLYHTILLDPSCNFDELDYCYLVDKGSLTNGRPTEDDELKEQNEQGA